MNVFINLFKFMIFCLLCFLPSIMFNDFVYSLLLGIILLKKLSIMSSSNVSGAISNVQLLSCNNFRDSLWNVYISIFMFCLSKLFFRLTVASLVNEIHSISFGFILHSFIRQFTLPIIVKLLPEPAPAITSDALQLDKTTLL